ncbi:MAG: hypothetical protein LQ338_001394 [Usnochroma carphineum]|nr:MAG: hypothetical protein LQ338_001394 [Usnochroma carphineum]
MATGTLAIPLVEHHASTGASQPTGAPQSMDAFDFASASLPTLTNLYQAEVTAASSSSMPAECKMFKPYVPEIVLEAVCSLHMTPLPAGQSPTLNSACFGAHRPKQTALPLNVHQNAYHPPSAASMQAAGPTAASTNLNALPTMTMGKSGGSMAQPPQTSASGAQASASASAPASMS